MPKWLTTLLVLLLLLLFVVPNPVSAGNWTGNAIDSLVVFFRNVGNEVSGSFVGATDSTTSGGGSGTSDRRYPNGGTSAGDGTFMAARGAFPLPVAPPAEVAPAAAADGVLTRSRPVELHIPAIGLSSLFVGLGLEPDGTMDVPKTADAVGWLRDAASPGERGPAVVTAHVDWGHRKGAFADLARLRPGDEVTVDRADGSAAVFQVTRTERYAKAHFPSAEVYGDTDGAELRLITCGGPFDPAARSYTDNVVVYARMVGVS